MALQLQLPPSHKTTFVTAFLDLNEDQSKNKSPEKRFKHFNDMATVEGLPICLFVSGKFYEEASKMIKDHKNIYLMPVIELMDTWTYSTINEQSNLQLPEIRTDYKDTQNFLILMNAKIEFVAKAIQVNPFNTSHFAWIDFNISHVFSSPFKTLSSLSQTAMHLKTPLMLFPGCWTKQTSDSLIHNIYGIIHWRFCGGFFIGDMNSLIEFYKVYQTHFPEFLREYKKLVWEVNFWAW